MAHILLLNGPNLNLLGTREPGVYGVTTLKKIEETLTSQATALGHQLTTYQSNGEHDLIQKIHHAKTENCDFIIINPAAYTHTSVALRDALLAVSIPFIEVHLSNTQARESFRHHSYFSDIALGYLAGFGALSYELALTAAHHFLQQSKHHKT